jgi:hypothetical protein
VPHSEQGDFTGGSPSFYRDSSVANVLLHGIEKEMRMAGCSFATLDATAPLARAIRLYERNGYVRSGVVLDFFVMPLYEYRKQLQPDNAAAASSLAQRMGACQRE